MTAGTQLAGEGMSNRRAMGLLVLAVAGVSSAAVLTTWLLEGDPDPRRALSLALWRCGGGAAVLGLVALRSPRVRLDERQLRRLGVSGMLLGLHFALFLGALAFTSVASATTLATLSPVIVALGSIWWLHEVPTRRTVVGMTITLVAALAVGATDLLSITGVQAVIGDLMAFTASVLIAGSLVIGRAERAAIPAVQYSFVVFGFAAVTLAVVVAASGSPWMPWQGTEWFAVIGMIVGPQLVGHFLIQTLLSDLPAVVVSTAVLTEPIFASVLAWMFLGQLPPAGLYITGPLVLLGVAIAITGARGPGPPPRDGDGTAGPAATPDGATLDPLLVQEETEVPPIG